MTYPAPDFLTDDDWFGPAVLSDKSKAAKAALKVKEPKPTLHVTLYKIATKTKLTCERDQPWISGAGR